MRKWVLFVFILLFGTFISAEYYQASANYYKRGNQVCSDFSGAERDYRADPEHVATQVLYASCLVIKGKDTEGLTRLHRIADNNNHVDAAFFIAEYLMSGGTFSDYIDESNYDKALKAYFKVLAFINADPSYPSNGRWVYELSSQIELHSYYYVPLIYMEKFYSGLYGSYNQKLSQSPSYTGDWLVEYYTEHNLYTQDNLRRVIENAGRCSFLPRKGHFKPPLHSAITKSCRLLKELAEALLPMERERLILLEACPDISEESNKCPEYYALSNRMGDIILQNMDERHELFRSINLM